MGRRRQIAANTHSCWRRPGGRDDGSRCWRRGLDRPSPFPPVGRRRRAGAGDKVPCSGRTGRALAVHGVGHVAHRPFASEPAGVRKRGEVVFHLGRAGRDSWPRAGHAAGATPLPGLHGNAALRPPERGPEGVCPAPLFPLVAAERDVGFRPHCGPGRPDRGRPASPGAVPRGSRDHPGPAPGQGHRGGPRGPPARRRRARTAVRERVAGERAVRDEHRGPRPEGPLGDGVGQGVQAAPGPHFCALGRGRGGLGPAWSGRHGRAGFSEGRSFPQFQGRSPRSPRRAAHTG